MITAVTTGGNYDAVTAPVREAFSLSRSLEFFSESELTKQIGYPRHFWPVAILKELLDNALDHCEEIGRLPDIQVSFDGATLSVKDNGDGIPEAAVEGMLDFDRRYSNREAYRCPTRGAQGNAGKCIVAIPYVLCGDDGMAVIESQGVRHEIAVSVDPLAQQPIVRHEKVHFDDFSRSEYPCTIGRAKRKKVQIGTFCQVRLAKYPCTIDDDENRQIVLFCQKYAALNPHLTLTLSAAGQENTWVRTSETCNKWTAADAEPPGWHDPESFERLLGATIAADREHGRDRLLRDFVRQFAGLKRSEAIKAVFCETGLARASLSSLLSGDGLDRHHTGALLSAIQKHGKTPPPKSLGCVGRRHIEATFSELGASAVKYRKVVGECGGLPFVVEAAFAELDADADQFLAAGCNFSPSVDLPVVRSLDWLLADQMIHDDSPVALLVHVAIVAPVYLDRGKSVVASDGEIDEAVRKCVIAVTDDWRRQRKREERDAAAAGKRQDRRRDEPQATLRDAIREVLGDAIRDASGGGACRFSDRDLYYATRKLIQEHTRKTLSQKYFDRVVDEWECEHGIIEDRLRDPRGFLLEPHTGKTIPLGTTAVEDYSIPRHLYDTIIYVEKKGLLEKFRFGKIGETYDCAIIAAEGYAVRAAKSLIHAAQHGRKMKVLVFHDADPDGINIARTLARNTGAHRYSIAVIDCGLRIDEAIEMGLEAELFERKKSLPKGLSLSAVEQKYFCGEARRVCGRSGRMTTHYVNCRRIELNALSADPHAFVAWIKSKLEEHGVAKKLVPPQKVIQSKARELRDSILSATIREKIEEKIDIETLVNTAKKKTIKQVDITSVIDDIAEWAGEMRPEPWTACVDRLVRAATKKINKQIDTTAKAEMRRRFGGQEK